MIARIWHGVTPSSEAGQYLTYLNETGIPDYRATEGNQGVYICGKLRRTGRTFCSSRYGNHSMPSSGLPVLTLRKPGTIPKTMNICWNES